MNDRTKSANRKIVKTKSDAKNGQTITNRVKSKPPSKEKVPNTQLLTLIQGLLGLLTNQT